MDQIPENFNSDIEKINKNTPSRIIEISVEEICLNPMQPRKNIREKDLEDLAQSIREVGIIQPVVLTRKDGLYHLVVGERRLRAAKLIGMEKIPAILKESTWEDMLVRALVENLQREDLNPIEEARAYKLLMADYKYTQEEISAKIGKSRPYVANMLRLLNLPHQVVAELESGEISAGHGRALLRLDNERNIIKAVGKIKKYNLSVRQTEELVKSIKESQDKTPVFEKPIPREYIDVRDRLSEKLSTRVEIKPGKKNSGRIEIHYNSIDDFNRLIEILGVEEKWF